MTAPIGSLEIHLEKHVLFLGSLSVKSQHGLTRNECKSTTNQLIESSPLTTALNFVIRDSLLDICLKPLITRVRTLTGQ